VSLSDHELQMTEPWQRAVLVLLSRISVATTATAVLVFLIGLAIVLLAAIKTQTAPGTSGSHSSFTRRVEESKLYSRV
jgi:hypothetical protein